MRPTTICFALLTAVGCDASMTMPGEPSTGADTSTTTTTTSAAPDAGTDAQVSTPPDTCPAVAPDADVVPSADGGSRALVWELANCAWSLVLPPIDWVVTWSWHNEHGWFLGSVLGVPPCALTACADPATGKQPTVAICIPGLQEPAPGCVAPTPDLLNSCWPVDTAAPTCGQG